MWRRVMTPTSLPFCAFKLLTGLLALGTPLAPVGIVLLALGAVDLALNAANLLGLVVAHRASTVMLADRVALLVDGRITHVGTHRDLLDTVPSYRELLAADADLSEAAR